MCKNEKRIVLYMCFETDIESESCQSMVLSSNSAEVEKWKRDRKSGDIDPKEKTSGPGDNEIEPSASKEDAKQNPHDSSNELSNLMGRFQETMSSYRTLIVVGISIMPVLRQNFAFNEMYKNAHDTLHVVERDEEFVIFGVTGEQYQSVKGQIRRLREFDKGETVLPGAILLSLVATFDSFIADMIRMMLKKKPESLIESSKTIGIKEVLNMSSFDDVVSKIVENEVDSVMRSSHDEQIKYIEEKMCIKIRSHYDGWGNFVEVFERRNLVAHGNLTINSRYITNCKRHGYLVNASQDGESLSLDGRYLRKSSDRLLEFGLSLLFVLWLRYFEDSSEQAYESFNHRTYELIRDGQPHVAAKLLDLALFKQKPVALDRTRKMMTVNLANAYKKMRKVEMADDVISKVDWSATTDDFQICIASLNEDIQRVVELMPKVALAGSIEKSAFREWPVFDWVREEEAIQEKFEETFGEPIMQSTDEAKREIQSSLLAQSEVDKATLH